MPSRSDRPSTDDFIQRGITLERFGNTTALRVRGMLDDLYAELIADLARIDPGAAPKWRDARLQKLAGLVEPLINDRYGTITEEFDSDLQIMAGDESRWLRDMWNRTKGMPEEALLDVALTKRDLKNLASNLMIEGSPAAAWWQGQSSDVQDKFMREVRMGVMRGESVADMARRIRGAPTGNRYSWYTKRGEHRWNVEFEGGVLQANTRQAQALVRTAVQTIAGNTRRETYMANADVIKGIEQISTLDNRTTKICMAYDGEKWEFEDEDRKGAQTETARKPPKATQAAARKAQAAAAPSEMSRKDYKDLADVAWPEFTEAEQEDLIHWQEKDMGQDTAFTLLQSMLRQDGTKYVSKFMRPRLEQMRDHIDSAMAKAAKHNPQMDVYRGVGKDFFEGLLGRNWETRLEELVGTSFTDEGYVATSPWKDVPEIFSPAGVPMFKIKIPEGARAVVLDETEEFLLARNSRFIIDEIDYSGWDPILIARLEQGE